MSDHEALVKVNLRTGVFELSGTETFIEKMIATISPLFPSPDKLVQEDSVKDETESVTPRTKTLEDLGEFIAAKGITRNTAAEISATAFVYYLTKVKGAEYCTREEVAACYDEAGLNLPNNLAVTLANLKKTDRKGYLATAGYGQYKLTVAGRNYVNEMSGVT